MTGVTTTQFDTDGETVRMR